MPRKGQHLWIVVVLFLFTLTTVFVHRHDVGEDLGSSYVGCRLMASGNSDHLYSHSTFVFSTVPDRLWKQIGRQAHFSPVSLLHPYVQTPLWAYGLIPVCQHMNFRVFFRLFLILASIAMSVVIWLITRFWAPSLYHPLPIAITCVLLSFSEPFRYAIYLVQTHVFFILLSIVALLLVQKNRPIGGGACLALAAAVKITPGFLILYWLCLKQYKAVVSFLITSVVLLAVTYQISGPALFFAYLRSLSETSKVLLVSWNVQSFAAWITAWHFGAWEQQAWKTHALPNALKYLSLLLALGSAVVGGLIDRRLQQQRSDLPPYGAAFSLVGVTMFTPIAWNHYYILLVLPLLILFGTERTASPRSMALLIGIILLNLYNVPFGIKYHVLGPTAIIRTQWYSGVLALIALLLAFRRHVGMKTLPAPLQAVPSGA